MKGIITLNVEIDYSTMLNPQNIEAIHLFTGAVTVEEMIKFHMDNLSNQLVKVIDGKPLVRYDLDGRLRKDVAPEQQVVEAPAEQLPESLPTVEPTEVIDLTGEQPIVLQLEEPVAEPEPVEDLSYLVQQLNENLQNVSVNLGIPQSIKANAKMREAITQVTGAEFEPEKLQTYQGFPVHQEGMDAPFLIVYKTYSGTEIKIFDPQQEA